MFLNTCGQMSSKDEGMGSKSIEEASGSSDDTTTTTDNTTTTDDTTTTDTTEPTIISFTSTTADGSYKSADTVNITATSSEAVFSGNTITATLDTGDTVLLTAAANGTTLVGTYTVGAGDSSSDLTVSSFSIGTVTDIAGNAMTSTTVPGTNIASGSAIVIDTTAPTVSSIYPTDNQSSVSITDNISVTFSEAMDTTSVTTNTDNTTCYGSFQLSSNNFTTCVQMTSAPTASNSNMTFTVNPSDNFSYLTIYKIGISTESKDLAGNTISNFYTTTDGFTTITGNLTITYNGNGNSSGSVPTDGTTYDEDSTATVLANTGNLAKSGSIFASWNTTDNGSGTPHLPGSTLNIGTDNVTVYALWVSVSGVTTVTADGSGNYTTIQAAINASSNGDTVLVLPGTYVENIDYDGKLIVLSSVYTTTSNKNYISSTIIDGNQSETVVKFVNSELSYAKIVGFTIQNGASNHIGSSNDGGGVLINNSSPTLERLVIKNNSSVDDGAGIYASSTNSTFNEIEINNNNANDDGGGIYCVACNNSTFTNISLKNNSGKNLSIYIKGSSSTNFSGIKINNNSHGGIYIDDSSIALENILIYNSNSVAPSIKVEYSSSSVSIYNATIVGVTSPAIFIWKGAQVTLKNSIVWTNSNEEIGLDSGWGSSISITYSNIEGGYTGTGNINSDPLFVDVANGDYHLTSSSPSLGTGTSSGAPNVDIDNNTRPYPSGTNPDMGAYEM